MSRFKQYLIERTMTFDMALKVFGISSNEVGDTDLLKKKYRTLAIKHHPDRGGKLQDMQDVNDAYALLSKEQGKQTQREKDEEQREIYKQKYRSVGASIKTSLLSNFQSEVFTKYFQEQSGFKFNYEITRVWPTDKQMTGKYNYPQSAGFNIEFFTPDRKTVFNLDINVDLTQVVFPKAELGNSNITWNTYTNTYGIHMNKKQKFAQRDWSFTRDNSFFKKPEILFPEKKLKAIFSGKTSKRKFMKRDMETFIKLKLKGEINGEFAYIPIGEDYKLVIYRSVIMRMGAWGVNGIYLKHSRVSGKNIYVSFMEDEETAKIFEKIQKELMKVKGEAKVSKGEQIIKQAYESYKKSKGV